MIRSINITAVSNGFIVQVGCQQVVFTSVGDLCDLLSKYLRNPEDTEKNFMATAANVRHTMGLGVVTPAYAGSEGLGQLAGSSDQYAVAREPHRDPRHPNSISEEYTGAAVLTTTGAGSSNRY